MAKIVAPFAIVHFVGKEDPKTGIEAGVISACPKITDAAGYARTTASMTRSPVLFRVSAATNKQRESNLAEMIRVSDPPRVPDKSPEISV